MNARISITVAGDTFERDYFICETGAPQAYDYPGALQITGDGRTRIVAIPQGDYEVQTGRYQSGMYGTRKLGEASSYVDPSFLIDALLSKLQGS